MMIATCGLFPFTGLAIAEAADGETTCVSGELSPIVDSLSGGVCIPSRPCSAGLRLISSPHRERGRRIATAKPAEEGDVKKGGGDDQEDSQDCCAGGHLLSSRSCKWRRGTGLPGMDFGDPQIK
jgi:hypothetical protein